MKPSEIKKLIISSLNHDADPREAAKSLEENGVSFNFNEGFADKILARISSPLSVVNREKEFVKYMNFAFYRIAIPGVAAIILLLISIYMMEGSLSLNSFLGMSDSYDESIVSLLTGN